MDIRYEPEYNFRKRTKVGCPNSIRTQWTKKEPACSVVEQAGVPIDRVIGLSIDRKGIFYLLTIAFGKWIVKELNHSASSKATIHD